MPNLKFVRTHLVIQGNFAMPISEWNTAQSTFIKLVLERLSKIVIITPSDIIVKGGLSLADVSVALRIYGGNSTIQLQADRLSFEFPSATREDAHLIFQLIKNATEAFREFFPERLISSIAMRDYEHSEFTGGEKVTDYLARYLGPINWRPSDDIGSATIEAGPQFRAISTDGRWNALFAIERSHVVTNGLFIRQEINASWNSDLPKFEALVEFFARISRACFSAADLVYENAAGNAPT